MIGMPGRVISERVVQIVGAIVASGVSSDAGVPVTEAVDFPSRCAQSL
jgi:hypothetical protein